VFAEGRSRVLRSETDEASTAEPPTRANAARRGAMLLGALSMLGCSSSQVAPDYAGEPLAVLHGALAADTGFDASMPDGMTVGLVWLVGSPDGSQSPLVAETAPTDGEFPFGFRLTIFSPPGPEAQSMHCPSGSCAAPEAEPSPVYQGLVAALDARTDLGQVTPLDILGASLDYGVFYFERDANPDDPTDLVATSAAYYNVPAVRGYHLYAIQKNEELFAAERRCAANGLCIESKVGGGAAAQYWPDHAFEECLALVPDAITCTSYPTVCKPTPEGSRCSTYFDDLGIEPTPAELEENARCDELLAEHLPPESCGGTGPIWQFPGNPLGFEANVSIKLGAGLYELMN
jgi:hypothetical protein